METIVMALHRAIITAGRGVDRVVQVALRAVTVAEVDRLVGMGRIIIPSSLNPREVRRSKPASSLNPREEWEAYILLKMAQEV